MLLTVCELCLCYNYRMKICSKCSLPKPEAEYFVKDKKSGRLHAQCKACYREHRKTYYAEHYEKYKTLYRSRAKERRHTLKREFQDNIIAYLTGKCCSICNESDMRTLEFDHINPDTKLFSVSQAVKLGYRWKDIAIEIQKCRILCANCHKKHTASQQGWYKNLEARTGIEPA